MKALKKHGGLEEEVVAYQSVVTGLQKQSDSLVSGDHFDSANITARQVGGAYLVVYKPFMVYGCKGCTYYIIWKSHFTKSVLL